MSTTTPSLYRAHPTATVHLLADRDTTRCGRTAGPGARFDASDLPSGTRNFRICDHCRTATPKD